ncbi:Uncharacterised protein [Bordetella trematum]|uniref:Uncharacterized protein n=1 Tax=Bordetella trematum TaxID=123899 RepID=A0A157SP69_9BORD|nr:Uncharacterised protein [Bordetella trematum]
MQRHPALDTLARKGPEAGRERPEAEVARMRKRAGSGSALRQPAEHLVAAESMGHALGLHERHCLRRVEYILDDHHRAAGQGSQHAVEPEHPAHRQHRQQHGVGLIQAQNRRAATRVTDQGGLRMHHQFGCLGRARRGEQDHDVFGIRAIGLRAGRHRASPECPQRPGAGRGRISRRLQHGDLLQSGRGRRRDVGKYPQRVQPGMLPMGDQQPRPAGTQQIGDLVTAVTRIDRNGPGPQTRQGQQQGNPLRTVEQPQGHRIAAPDTAAAQPGRRLVHALGKGLVAPSSAVLHEGSGLRLGPASRLDQAGQSHRFHELPHARSNTAATPCPPPTHMVSSA